MVDDFIPEEPSCYDIRSWSDIYLPGESHFADISKSADALEITVPTTRLMSCLAGFLKSRAAYAEAELLMRRALSIDEQSYRTKHPNVARDLNNLAQLLQATNRLVEAEPLMRRVVEIFIAFGKTTGHEHPHMQAAFGNYFTLLTAMGISKDEAHAKIQSKLREDEQ